MHVIDWLDPVPHPNAKFAAEGVEAYGLAERPAPSYKKGEIVGINQSLYDNVSDPSVRKTAEAYGTKVIRDRIREDVIVRQVLEAVEVGVEETQRSLTHNGLEIILDREPDTTAAALNFSALPEGHYLLPDRAAAPFFTIASRIHYVTQQMLYAFQYPVTSVVERQDAKNIGEVEDTIFFQAAYEAMVASTSSITKSIPDATKAGFTVRTDLLDPIEALIDDQVQVGCMVMPHNQLLKWMTIPSTDMGDIVASQNSREGWTSNKLMGYRFITTTKSAVQRNEVWCFAPRDFIGRFYCLEGVNMWIDRHFNYLMWGCWEMVALLLFTNRGISRKVYTSEIADARAA